MKARSTSKKPSAAAKKAPARKSSKAKPAAAPRATKSPKAKSSRPTKVAAPVVPAAPKREFPQLLVEIVRALDAKKVDQLVVLGVSELSSITDYLVIGTATSQPHLRALRVELEKVIDGLQAKILGMDTGRESGWTVVDAFDVMVHLFTPENREKYRLELLWKDAQVIPVSAVL